MPMDDLGAVLVVDDDGPGRAMLGLILRQSGLKVVTAAGGPEALKILERQGCAAMITDAKMSPMDGFELSERAKELQPSLRIALISAVFSDSDIAGRPIDRFFEKPVPVDGLLDWLSEIGRPPSA